MAAGDAVEISLRDKIATQSSTASNAKASRATDGNTDTTFSKNSCTATKQEESPWWSVDLDRKLAVKSVTVFNRGDCCGDRLNGFEVKVGDEIILSLLDMPRPFLKLKALEMEDVAEQCLKALKN